MQRAAAAERARRRLEGFARLARDAGDAKAVAREARRDGEADAAARAGDQHIIHGGPAFRPSVIGSSATKRKDDGAMWAGKRGAAGGENVAPGRLVGRRARVQHDLGGDNRAGDRVLAREDPARADGGIAR